MKPTRIAAALGLAALAALPLPAHDFKFGDLVIGHPYVPATAPTAKTAAGYLTITNEGDVPDRLIGVRSTFPRAMLHATEVDAQGVARMRDVDAVEIPPGATVELAPQGLHVMFLGFHAGPEPGSTIDATLVFERAGETAVQFNVEERTGGGMEPTKHDTHGGG